MDIYLLRKKFKPCLRSNQYLKFAQKMGDVFSLGDLSIYHKYLLVGKINFNYINPFTSFMKIRTVHCDYYFYECSLVKSEQIFILVIKEIYLAKYIKSHGLHNFCVGCLFS